MSAAFRTTNKISSFAIAAGTSALIACGGGDSAGPTGPSTGSIRVTVSTTGQDFDPDGYIVTVGPDRNPSAAMEP
jgi:hypothetical protein